MRHRSPPSPRLSRSGVGNAAVGHGRPYWCGESRTSITGVCASARSVSWIVAPSRHVALAVQSKRRCGDSTVALAFIFCSWYRHWRIDQRVATANAAHEPQLAWFCACVNTRHARSTIAYCEGSAPVAHSSSVTSAKSTFIRYIPAAAAPFYYSASLGAGAPSSAARSRKSAATLSGVTAHRSRAPHSPGMRVARGTRA